MSPDLASIENIWQLLKIKLRKKLHKWSIFDLGNKVEIEVFTIELGFYTCTSLISQIIKSDSDFI